MTDSEIIDALGGTSAVAKAFGLDPATVSVWRERGIAWRWRGKIADMMRERDAEIPDDFLVHRRIANAA